MSVKLQLKNKSCSKDELGAYCFCRHSGHKEENNVDYPFKETNIYIDMEEVEKSSQDVPSGILMTIPINFGVVAVDKKTYHDIHFIHTKFDKIPRRLQCRSDKYRMEKIDDAFSITFPNSNVNCWPPHLASMVYNDEFLIWADNTPFRFLCRGYSEGPSMCLGQNILNFGAVIANNERKHVIEVHNYSQSTAIFQFDVDNNRSSFQVCPTSGSLLPMTKKLLEITFKPEKPQMYYKRMYCLVHQQSSQFIDLMGVCLPNRPDFLLKELQLGISSVDTNFIPLPSISDDEYFKRNLWGIKFHKDEINFGFHDIYFEDCTPTSRKLTVSSTLPYDVNFEWMEDSTGIFGVVPQQQILEKGGSVQFNVEFSPNFPDSFYNGQMECYIYPKSYNWPNDSGPPWICKSEKAEKMRKAQKRKKRESNYSDKAVRINKQEHKTHKDKKKHCEKLSTKEDISHEGMEGHKSKHTPLEISIHRYNDVKGRLILLRARKHFGTGNHKSKAETLKTSTTRFGGDETTDSFRVDEKDSKIGSVKSNPQYDSVSKYTLMQSTNIASMKDDALEKKENLDISDIASQSSKSLKGMINKEATDKEKKHKLRRESKISRRLQSNMDIRDKNIQPKRHNKLTKLPQSLMDIAIPLSRSIRVTGHSFGLTNPPHVSQVEMPRRIIMGPTLPKKRVCATTILSNKSDLPACFDVKYLDKKSGYRLKPRMGVIPGKKCQILLTSLNPRHWGTLKYVTRSLVNLNLQDNFAVEIVGAAQIPNLTILLCYESSTKHCGIVCPITIPGCCTETNMEFINHSRFHFSFHLEPTHPDQADWQIFAPYPKKGFLSPNERVRVRWKFVPLECITYKVRWRFRFSVVKGGNESSISKGSNYEMKMSLTGVGQFCTLQASQKTLDFDILQIFDKETKMFTVQNLGNCGVRAKLAVYHEQWLDSFPKSVINISPAKLVLAAGESVEISVTVRPTRTSLQKFYIEYQLDLTEKDEYEEVLFVAEPVRLIDITFMGDHVNFKVTDLVMISRHPLWSTEHCWNMFSINKMNELLAPFPLHNVPHEYTVPKISTVNFRFPPAPVNSEAAIFCLMLSNMSDGMNNNGVGHWEILSEPVEEIAPNQSHQQPTKRRRSTFCGGDVRDSPDFLQILWNQKMTSSGKKKSYAYNAKHHGTLHWINLRRQTYGHNLLPLPGQQANASTQNTYFTILPPHGTIKNKSNQQIIFKFSYTEIGNHKMTILLRVYPGIFVWLELFGRTLAPNQGYIQYMYKETMLLHPVSLSDLDPPVQMFWIYNGGNVPCTYDVDEKPFEEWKLNNFGHAVVQCLNPKGTVPPKAWFPIKIRFSPLEYANYDVPLKIKSENHEDTTVILKGNVSHNALVDLKLNCTPNETVRNSSIINPLVPVSLSPTRLTINHFIPTGEKFTSVVFITNLSSKHKMSFTWQDFVIEGGGSITFQPNSKLLQPNEEVASMVIVRAGKVSTTFSCMIRCMIEDETANAHYEEELEFYMDAQRLWRNKQFNYKLPEPRKFAVDKLPTRPEKPENFSRTLAISLYIGTVFGMLDSLPPEEKSKLPFADRICPPLTTKPNALSLLPFGRHLSKDIISNMLWEIVHTSTFEEFAKCVSKRQPPYFNDYKEAESIGTENEEIEEKLTLSKQTTGEILECTIFNMMQEIANNYSDPGSMPTTSTDSHKAESGVH